jgi:hypothetical protein
MSSLNDAVIYLKMSVRSFLRYPGFRIVYSNLKHYPDWKKYLSPAKSPVSEKMPWITFSSIDLLEKIIQPGMKVFEYGSGGSTLFWASRVKNIVSVEHDKGWFEKMQTVLSVDGIGNVDYLLIEPVDDPEFSKKTYQDPDDYVSRDQHYTGQNFEKYAKAIDPYPDLHFDVIVVDGRVRPSCIKHALPKLKKNGWLLLDNSDRSYYLEPFSFNKPDWKTFTTEGPVPFLKHFSRTTLFQKCY